MPLSPAICVITVTIPSTSESEPLIVAKHLSEHDLISLNKYLSLTIWTLAALSNEGQEEVNVA